MSTAQIQLFDNPQTRCAVVLLLDTSGSMAGAPITALNDGFRLFVQEVLQDDCARFAVELAVVTFGGDVTVAQGFTPMAHVTPQTDNLPVFDAGGGTPMGEALNKGMTMLARQKDFYRSKGISYYQPWLVLLTDGQPTDEYQTAAARACEASNQRKLVFIGVGVGDSVDMNILSTICPPNRAPKKLSGLKFAEFFLWLSQSMAQVSRSATADARVNLPHTDGWASI